jgi:hypothetical protein
MAFKAKTTNRPRLQPDWDALRNVPTTCTDPALEKQIQQKTRRAQRAFKRQTQQAAAILMRGKCVD